MDFEQILIRLGVDAKAAMMGMTSFKSWAKGWATDLGHTLKHHLLGAVGAGAAMFGLERLFEGFKERALFINRLSKETGLSTNMIQGMSNELNMVGESFESINKPLGKFSVLIGQAKEGIPDARRKLIEWGIAAKNENFNNLNLTNGLIKLARQYDALGSSEEKNALLQSVFAKQWQSMVPLFEHGADALERMGKASALKFTPDAIQNFQELFTGEQSASKGIMAKLGNRLFGNMSLGAISVMIRGMRQAFGGLTDSGSEFGLKHMGVMERIKYILHGTRSEEQQHNDTLKEKQGLLNENLKIQQEENEALRLQNELQDRGKSTVGHMADMARERMGLKGMDPLSRFRAVTPAMVSAMRIDDLEKGAQVAALSGNDVRRASLMGQADKLRLQNMALTSKEQDPMKEVRQRLEIVNETLSRSGVHIKSVQPGNHEE